MYHVIERTWNYNFIKGPSEPPRKGHQTVHIYYEKKNTSFAGRYSEKRRTRAQLERSFRGQLAERLSKESPLLRG
jgi:hypothetical protein